MILSYYFGGFSMKMNKKRSAVTISMPKDMAEEYDKLAKRLAKNRSALFRSAFVIPGGAAFFRLEIIVSRKGAKTLRF
jgi:hypothetical protein